MEKIGIPVPSVITLRDKVDELVDVVNDLAEERAQLHVINVATDSCVEPWGVVWRSCDEEPEENTRVILWMRGGFPHVITYVNSPWGAHLRGGAGYWMPIPDLPEVE